MKVGAAYCKITRAPYEHPPHKLGASTDALHRSHTTIRIVATHNTPLNNNRCSQHSVSLGLGSIWIA